MKPGAFATGVAARHVSEGGSPRRAAIVLLRPRRPVVLRRIAGARHLHQRWMLRLSLQMKRVQQLFRTAPISATTVQRHSVLPGRLPAIASRGTVQVRRIERATTAPRPGTAPSPLPLVTRRVSPADAAERPPGPPPRGVAQPRESAPAPTRALPAPLPAGELDRVTEHVIRNLDRRLGSWRERRGKS